jgi:hypothetical protein
MLDKTRREHSIFPPASGKNLTFGTVANSTETGSNSGFLRVPSVALRSDN